MVFIFRNVPSSSYIENRIFFIYFIWVWFTAYFLFRRNVPSCGDLKLQQLSPCHRWWSVSRLEPPECWCSGTAGMSHLSICRRLNRVASPCRMRYEGYHGDVLSSSCSDMRCIFCVSGPVGCSHEQAFRRDGEDLDVEGFWAGVQVLVVLHVIQTLHICTGYIRHMKRYFSDQQVLQKLRIIKQKCKIQKNLPNLF